MKFRKSATIFYTKNSIIYRMPSILMSSKLNMSNKQMQYQVVQSD